MYNIAFYRLVTGRGTNDDLAAIALKRGLTPSVEKEIEGLIRTTLPPSEIGLKGGTESFLVPTDSNTTPKSAVPEEPTTPPTIPSATAPEEKREDGNSPPSFGCHDIVGNHATAAVEGLAPIPPVIPTFPTSPPAAIDSGYGFCFGILD